NKRNVCSFRDLKVVDSKSRLSNYCFCKPLYTDPVFDVFYCIRYTNGIEMLSYLGWSLCLKAKHSQQNIIIITLLVRLISANNSSHGTFEYASNSCSQQGGLAYTNIVTTSLLTDYKVNNCSLANGLGLNDGEAMWLHLQADLG
ncbi:hypothetical protein MAR_017754, partial [Mya arenaria]